MGLINKTNDGKSFEDGEGAAVAAGTDTPVSASAAAPASAPASAPAAATAVATKPAGAVALASNSKGLETFKDALPVEYNTLDQVIATNGNFVDRESKLVLGDTVVFDLLSYQDSWVVSPNDDKAPKDVVRFSNDGVVCTDGVTVEEHLKTMLQSGYPKASLKQRSVIVGAIQGATKNQTFNGKLMQFDLSPTSRTQWMRYQANSMYKIKVGSISVEQAARIKATAELASNGANTYTLAKFDMAQ